MTAVNLRHERCDIRIDRKTRWGNPFVMGRDGDRDEVCEKYRTWLWDQIRNEAVTIADLAELDGKKLGCHCAPLRCHGDTLSAAARWAAQKLAQDNGSH